MRPDQLEEVRRLFWQWRQFVAPCQISHVDVYNPCLPNRDDRGLWCVTCGLRQRLALEAA